MAEAERVAMEAHLVGLEVVLLVKVTQVEVIATRQLAAAAAAQVLLVEMQVALMVERVEQVVILIHLGQLLQAQAQVVIMRAAAVAVPQAELSARAVLAAAV